MKKLLTLSLSALSALTAISAFANSYPVASLTVSIAKSCATGVVSASDPSSPGFGIRAYIESSSPLAGQLFTNEYSGKEQGFQYSLDQNGTVTLIKKKSAFDFFGSDTSITLGTLEASDYTDLCTHAVAGYQGYDGRAVRVNLLANVQAVQNVQWTGSCYKHSLWPNDSGSDYYKPFSESLVISDSRSNSSITLSLSTAAEIGSTHDSSTSIDTCNATALP